MPRHAAGADDAVNGRRAARTSLIATNPSVEEVMNATRKLTAIREPFSKAQVYAHLAEETGLSKKDIAAVFEALKDLIHRHLKSRAAGAFTLPGLLKLNVVKKAATKERKGINPFTGEPAVFKAKPASRQVKVRVLKGLKDLAS